MAGEHGKNGEHGKDEELIYPTFPYEHNIVVDGSNIQDFFYLACGEEEQLALMKDFWKGNHKNENKTSTSTKTNDRNRKSASSSVNSNPKVVPEQFLFDTTLKLKELDDQCRIPCTIAYSTFHPPPPHRRLKGDIAYLEVTLPLTLPGPKGLTGQQEMTKTHITAVPMGFYVNRTCLSTSNTHSTNSNTSSNTHYTHSNTSTSTNTTAEVLFDPNPCSNHCFSHALLDCLLLHSETLRALWVSSMYFLNSMCPSF